MRQNEKLTAYAAKQNKPLGDLLKAAYADDVKSLLKPDGEYETAEAIFTAGKDKEVQTALQEKFNQRVAEMLKDK